jgi:hypothetical protein
MKSTEDSIDLGSFFYSIGQIEKAKMESSFHLGVGGMGQRSCLPLNCSRYRILSFLHLSVTNEGCLLKAKKLAREYSAERRTPAVARDRSALPLLLKELGLSR